MKRLFAIVGILNAALSWAQPQSLHPHVTVDTYAVTSRAGVRLAQDPVSKHLFYADTEGNVFRLQPNGSGSPTEIAVATAAQHGIEFLQGLLFADSTLVLSGIRRLPYEGVGRVVKGRLRPDGTRQWTTLLETDPYPYSGTAFDHAINGICLSPNRDSLYINSGSRTDHGEVQDNGGRFPNLRETALTARIFKVPLWAENWLLPNNDAALRQMGVLFCEGVRNTFDLAFNSEKRLFGAENAGNRSDPEELNWLRAGRHYGFPWNIGGNLTPQQFPNYDPNTDPLLSPWYRTDGFRNDPTYPPPPAGVSFTPGIRNTGPDGWFVLNPATGQLVPTDTIRTFTSHASPLGLVFDVDSLLADFTGMGFVLGYSPGRGLDLSTLRLVHDAVIDNYRVQVSRIAEGFNLPADAELVDTTLYVLERGRNAISRVRFRQRTTYPTADLSLRMTTDRRTLRVGQLVQVAITVRNDGPGSARQVRLSNRLPDGLDWVAGPAFSPTPDGLTATIDRLAGDDEQTLTYLARVTQPGTYRNAAQLTQARALDPDSTPNTGTADGEDDTATVDFRTLEPGESVRTSANPNGRVLPPVQSNQPPPDPNRCDLSLRLALSQRTVRANEVVTLLIAVENTGGQPASDVQVHCLVPGLTPELNPGWTLTGTELRSPQFNISVGQTIVQQVRMRVAAPGLFIIKATLLGPPDADSTPNNGYDNGEDDEATVQGRGRE